MRYDYLVFIGRFQPFHLGHQQVVLDALKLSHKVIILIGSVHQPRSVRNPWSYQERESFIRQSFSKEQNERIVLAPLQDFTYNEPLWIRLVQEIVNSIVHTKIASKAKIGIIGYEKDKSSYYLSQFPQWDRVEANNVDNISSTDIREEYFANGTISTTLGVNVSIGLEKFVKTQSYKEVANEYHFIKAYKKQWECVPYPPTFVTVDAIVIQSGHILLIERKAQPGKGLMALPGGFVDAHEALKTAVIRELREETRIKVPAPVLAGSITKSAVFDDPYRSARGRTITHAYLIELHGETLPKVKGGDDASNAFWVAFADISPQMMFEDHFQIIKAMVG
ncbi:MAG: ADP-ribose pyrophosphatase [Sulfurovum sp. AS07-7]|nr:MAG: ADP-ribose pyrophosphatase [Sulfurovum sp. AS07-7]